MQSITYSQIQELVMRLPAAKLPIAYDLLLDLVSGEPDAATSQLDFMLLPLIERRRLMAEQAEQMVTHYEQTKEERRDWQKGDFVEY
jgi:hypothetical protein